MGWDWKGVGSGAMSGASTGAMFGPWGAAIGGVGGGVLGGLKGGDKGPVVEDFNAAAEKTAMQNRPNTNTPWAQQSWSTGPDGRPVMNYNAAGPWAQLQGNMAKAASYDPTQARDAAISSNFNQGWSRLAPMQAQGRQAFNSGAANMGLDPGQQAYQAGEGNLQRGQADQYNSLMAESIDKGNATQMTQLAQMNQPFDQYSKLIQATLQQPSYGKGADYMTAAINTQKANDNAADRAASDSAGKKGGAGKLIGGAGGKKGGGGEKAAPAEYSSGGTWV